jgi:DNA-binding NarL/FixJ family response regulator
MCGDAADHTLTAPKSIRIAVINDHPVFRGGLVRLLKRVDGIEIVGEGATAADAVEVARKLAPDIVLLDLGLPGSSAQAAADIASVCPKVRTVVLTHSENEEDVASALRAGARGCILAGSSGREVVEMIRAVAHNDFHAAPKLAPRLLINDGKQISMVTNHNICDLDFSRKASPLVREE